jgi:membrane-bound ClpP family serine protease
MNSVINQALLFFSTLAIALPLVVIIFFALKLVIHSHRIKKTVAAGSMIGTQGRAESEISTTGLVFVRGELWHACSPTKIAASTTVRVIGFSRLALVVEAVSG